MTTTEAAKCESTVPAAIDVPAAPDPLWTVSTQDNAKAQELAQQLKLTPVIAHLLLCRSIDTAEAAQLYLNPKLSQLNDPFLMLGMATAVERIRAALTAREPVLIYGDYDVDGTVATVLLKTAIERMAAAMATTADVRYHIPHRIREGYGIQETRIEAAAAEGVRLVISVDTGIRAFAAAREAARLGLDLIVTDHHLPDIAEGIPQAVAVLNPNQPGCPYPYKELCGAGVAFKLAQALLETSAPDEASRERLREKTLPSFLKLLAIATIADAVPLTGENRVIATLGLRELSRPQQPGLRALMELAGIDLARGVSATDVGFRLAPRINAAGRMDIAADVVEMFLARDAAVARPLAEKLHRMNEDRRATEAEALRAIEQHITELEATPEGLAACLVLDDASVSAAGEGSAAWHRGVIGILASRVVERTGRPALVLAHDEAAGEAYGSGRSIQSFHLLNALTAAHNEDTDDPLLTRFGGHAHAVGFALPSERVPELRTRMERLAAAARRHTPPAPDLECHAALALHEITPEFLDALERLGPFGHGNHEPLFLCCNVRLATALKIVKERHLRLSVEDAATGARFGGMAWGRRTPWPERAQKWGLTQGSCVDIAFHLRRNWHPDFGGWELEVAAMRPASAGANHTQ